jgi:hypothetical protein
VGERGGGSNKVDWRAKESHREDRSLRGVGGSPMLRNEDIGQGCG